MNACFKISTTLSVLFALAACAEKPAEEPAPEKTDRIESDSPSLSFSAEESTQTFTLTANCDWQLAQVVDWFHASPASGKEGQTVITVRADANPTDEVRSAPLYAKAGGKALTTVIVTQLGKSEPEPEPEPGPEAPVADLLDIIFHPDGTAQDVSPSQMKVETIAGAGLSTYYNESFQRVVAHFANDMGKTVASGYYKIDYATNSEFRNRIADSHSWEAVVRIDADPAGFGEIKMFSCHQSGGTGFLISKAEQGNHLSFITHTGAWNWAESDIVPAVGRYYHLSPRCLRCSREEDGTLYRRRIEGQRHEQHFHLPAGERQHPICRRGRRPGQRRMYQCLARGHRPRPDLRQGPHGRGGETPL